MTIPSFPGDGKDPEEVLDYSIDFTDVIGVTPGDSVLASPAPVWTAQPNTLTIGSSSLNGSVATVFVSGGVEGEEYELSCLIQTAQGRTFVRSGKVKIAQR